MLLFLLSVLLVLTNACDCITSLEGITNYSNFPMYSNYSYQWMYYLLNDGVTSNNMLFLLKNSNNNWYEFNDQVITNIDRNKVITNNAYCFFFIKKHK